MCVLSLQCIYYLSPIRSPMVAVFPTDTCHHILYGKRNAGYYFSSCPFTMPYSFWLLNPLKSSANNSTELLSPGSPCQYLLLMSMQSSFFCVNVSLKMNMLGIEPQTPRFRVECASITPRVMFRDTQLSDQYWTSGTAVSADIVC